MKALKNILTINTANSGGGAEKVAFGLCKELHLRGYETTFMSRRNDYAADPLARKLIVPIPGDEVIYSAGNLLDEVLSTQFLFYLPSWKIPLMECVANSDVVHLHNMHGYYFNMLTIPFLMWQKPVVWTFHDMWPFTGKCVHAFDCERFSSMCGSCPQLGSYPKLTRDTTRFHLGLKRALYARARFSIVSPSGWLRSHIEKSFLKDHPIHVIPSPIDTRVFYPEDPTEARMRLQIPRGKKVLLFIASWINSIPSKGISIFKELLQALYAERNDLFTVVIGHLENESVLGAQFDGMETGWIDDMSTLRGYYSSADVFVSPTLAENSSCTIAEAMACGTAPVAFATGGVPEQITQGENGLLVPRGDISSLLEAIRSVLDNTQERTRMGRASAIRARENFAMDLCVEKHLRVYEEAMRMGIR